MKYKIFSNGEQINAIVADESFCQHYCEKNGYTYEAVEESAPEPKTAQPTTDDILNTLLGVTE